MPEGALRAQELKRNEHPPQHQQWALQQQQTDWRAPAEFVADEKAKARAAAADSAVAAAFLEGQVRRKTSRFADLVDAMQESQVKRDPYQNRWDEQQRQRDDLGPQRRRMYLRSSLNKGLSSREREKTRVSGIGDRTSVHSSGELQYLPLDVVRVERRQPPSSAQFNSTERMPKVWHDNGPEDMAVEGKFQESEHSPFADSDAGEYTDW